MNNALSRILKIIVDDRKPTIWGKELGIPVSTNSRMFKDGVYPADKHLRKIMKSENASMSALWGASSAPFMIHRTSSANETYESIKLHLEDEDWDIHIITGDDFPVIVLSTSAVDVDSDEQKEFKYTPIEVICGPVDYATANLFKGKIVKHKELSKEDAHSLATGYKGTYFLFGKPTLVDAKEIDQSGINKIFREKPLFNADVLKKVMEILDETIVQEGIEVSAEQRRKLVTELYGYAVKEGLVPEDVSPNLAHSMLRVI